MTPSEMLIALSQIWLSCVQHPDAKHAEILEHIEQLQLLIFSLD